jgi:MFS transporter, Spinster family, sphingosine-1-phosphate transporter
MSFPESGPALASGSGRQVSPFLRSPYFALLTLFSMNLLNYVDRYVFFSSGPRISKELHFSDTQFGYLSVSFMVVYTLVSPLIGILGDRYSRRRLISSGVALWSVATVGTAYASGFYEMFFWRALLGIGEASYGIIAPTLLADLFPPRYRGRVMGLYFLALPLGGAIGSGIGGWFSTHGDWRNAFWVVGVPGLFAALAGLLMVDPGRGASEGKKTSKADRPGLADYLSILKTRTFLFNTAGQAAVTFALGAYAVWAVTFYQRVRGMEGSKAGIWIGVLTAIGGLMGILLGTFAADALLRVTKRAYMLWPGIAVGCAVPCVLGTILVSDQTTSLAYLFVASVMMASVLGPSNTVTANVVPANRRAAGYALCIFLVHLFGDISSPLLIGFVSDLFGRPAIVASSLGQYLESIGARPFPAGDGRPANLLVGMLAVIPMLVLGSLFYFRGSGSLPVDQERAKPSVEDDVAFYH